MLSRRVTPQFLSFLVCGGIATIFDWSIFYVAAYVVKWNYMLAVTLSYITGSTINYVLNRNITFDNKYNNIPLQFLVFLTIASSALLLTYLLMIIFVQYINFGKMISRMIITAIIMLYNYNFHRFFTFGRLK